MLTFCTLKVIICSEKVKTPPLGVALGKVVTGLNWLIVSVSEVMLKKSYATNVVLLLADEVKGLPIFAKLGAVLNEKVWLF